MVAFNPTVQPGRDDSPNYFKYSEPIKDIKPDTGTGLALQTAGEAISGTASLVDEGIKGSINDTIVKDTDKARQDYARQLEGIKASLIPAPAQPASGGSVGSLTDTPQQVPVPAAVDSAIGKAQALQSALEGGKINDTYYHQRLWDIQKTVRSQYPGYRDYIDQKISQATGVQPANAYVNDLMQDINRLTAKKADANADVQRMLDKAISDNLPNADIMSKAYRAKIIGRDDVETFINHTQSVQDQLKLRESLRKYHQGTVDDIKVTREGDFANEVSAAITNNFNALITVVGTKNPDKIQDIIGDAAANPDKYSSEQLQALATQLTAQREKVKSDLQQRAVRLATDNQGNKYSYLKDIGQPKIDEILKSVDSAYNSVINPLIGGGPNGPGIAFWAANSVVSHDADVARGISRTPLGTQLSVNKYILDHMGNQWMGAMIDQSLRTQIDQATRGLLTDHTTAARAQADYDSTGKPVTFQDHADQMLKLEQDGKINAAMRGRYLGKLGNLIDDLNNPKAPDLDKVNVVRYLFSSTDGKNILRSFKTETSGSKEQGKYSMWNRLTSEDVVSAVAKLNKANPEIGGMYRNFLESEGAKQLFFPELKALQSLQDNPHIHFKYVSGDTGGVPYIKAIQDDNGVGVPQNYLLGVNPVLNRLNSAIAGMSRVQKGFGGDVDGFILNFFNHSNTVNTEQWEGIPKKIGDAIAISRTPQQRLEEAFGKSKQ